MAKFKFQPLIGTQAKTVRLGAGTTAANWLNDQDVNKPVKLVADSQYDLCVLGDAIEGFSTTVDTAPADGFSTGGYQDAHGVRIEVTFDGAQVGGAGAIAVGDYVLAGTIAAKNVAVGSSGPKVCLATDQAAAKAAPFAWRVISLGNIGTGAVGSGGLIERV